MQNYALPYRELMSYYRCAMMEVETKLNVLNEELSLQYDRNPIETIKTRLKSPESILEKLHRKNHPVTVDSIEQNLNDIAGVRVICAFPSDIYQLEEAFLKQDDMICVERLLIDSSSSSISSGRMYCPFTMRWILSSLHSL